VIDRVSLSWLVYFDRSYDPDWRFSLPLAGESLPGSPERGPGAGAPRIASSGVIDAFVLAASEDAYAAPAPESYTERYSGSCRYIVPVAPWDGWKG
jgi:hypothetical protein